MKNRKKVGMLAPFLARSPMKLPICTRSEIPKSKWRDDPLNAVTSGLSCSVVSRGCVNRIRLRLPGHDDHSGFVIGAGGTRRSDWSARVLTNGVNTRFDR